jgi:hypothetical protein
MMHRSLSACMATLCLIPGMGMKWHSEFGHLTSGVILALITLQVTHDGVLRRNR